jgi:hypothetical protein
MSNSDFNFKKILLNQLKCIKCDRLGDKQVINPNKVTERNSALKINSRILSSVKSNPENYYILQCYNCSEIHIIDRIKYENLVISKSKIGHWNESKLILLNEQGTIFIE